MIGKRVKCVCKESIEYALVGIVVYKHKVTVGVDTRIIYDVKWNNGEISSMYEHELQVIYKDKIKGE